MKELCICEEIFRLNGKNDQNETLSSDYSSFEQEYYFEIEFDDSFAGVSNWSLGWFSEWRFFVRWSVTSMLVTDVGDQICWWQVSDVGDRSWMLMTDLIHEENHQHKVANIMILSPTSEIIHHHKVTNITLTEMISKKDLRSLI